MNCHRSLTCILIKNRHGLLVAMNVLCVLLLTLLIPKSVEAQGGYTLEFDGSGDYVNCGNHSSLDITGSALTLEAWIYANSWETNVYEGYIIGKEDAVAENGYKIRVGNSGQINFEYGNGTDWQSLLSSTGVVSLNKWEHIAGVLDGTTMRIYLNGEEIATQPSTGTVSSTSADVVIGSSDGYSGTRFFDGKIDEARIWDDTRTPAEIRANMHKELTGSEGNLVAYYQMSNGSGTSLTDNSPNSNAGTLVGNAIWKTSGAHAGPGMALNFDGSDDEVQSTINMTSTDTFTLEAWLKFESLTGKQSPLDFQQTASGAQLTLNKENTTNLLSLSIDDGTSATTLYSTAVIAADQWYHVAIVYAEKRVLIYINGVQTLNGSTALSYRTTASNDFYIGASDGSSHSNVIIDEVRMWDDIRSQSEILSGMFRTLEGDETNLVAYYRFDQQSATGHTTLYDYTENGQDGTLSNMDATTDWEASSPFNTWIGSEDSDWSNADNWSSGSAPSSEDIGVYAWTGSNSPTSGNISGRNVYIDTDATVSHSGNLTISSNYFNAGTFSTSGSLTFSGSSMQFIAGSGPSTFDDLVVNNGAGVALAQNLTVSSTLTFSNGIVILNGNTLTLGSSAAVSGTPGGSNHINATSGSLRKDYSGTGSFLFPVGDGTVYSPITLNFTSGTFSTGYVSIGLTASKHPSNSSTTDYIRRYWTVNSSGITGFSCEVSAKYADGDTSGTESNFYGGKYSGGNWVSLGQVNTGSNLVTGTVTGFSDFTAGELTTFPVEWLNFTAKPEGSFVQLDWSTASELNSDYFAIERSTDQASWMGLGEVNAARYSSEVLRYQFEDSHPLDGKAYYRLRQVDLNGAYDFSNVVEITLIDSEMLTVYPNPVQEVLKIEVVDNQKMHAMMIDMQGRVVVETVLITGTNSLSVSHLPAGIYTLRLSDQQGWVQEKQIVKE